MQCASCDCVIFQGFPTTADESFGDDRFTTTTVITWVLPEFSNSWIIFILQIYSDLNSSPSIDCYCMGAVPKL